MAGNKVSAKTKGKEDKSKINKNVSQNNEDTEDIDYSLLRKPIPTSVTGFAQARKVFDLATEELKELLTNECDLLYECKVCRNIFRSLMNFISHKRIYCREKFNCTVHSNFTNVNSTANELLRIKKLEENYLEFLKEKIQTTSENIEENDDAIPLTKDLTTVIEKIATSRGVQEDSLNQQDVVLQKIPKTSVAVYQNLKYNDAPNADDMRAQVNELDTILSRQSAVLQSDGKFKIENSNVDLETEGVIQISDDEDNDCLDNLKCKMCELQFSTRKTLKSHIKTKHLESRLVYPCPDCLEIFSTSWSVYRHLFKVHRKTAAQIRRLRETIQSKSFRMNNPPAFYEKRKSSMKNAAMQKITEEERLEQENQAWMDNLEGDGELPRCGGCGRSFERRAALAAHTNTCQPRCRALARRPNETKKIEIQIRKDYNKGPNNALPVKPQDKNTNDELASPPKQKEKKETQGENTLTEAIMSIVGVTGSQETDDIEAVEQLVEDPPKDSMDTFKPVHKLPFSHQAEKSNFNALKRKILQDVELEQLSCKKCDMKCKQLNELYNHVAGHYKWLRYACKLCNFKHYEFDKVPEHVKIIHKLKGDSDFYYSTVKAIDGVEASVLSDLTDETNEKNETSPDSRRPSRCSSDSSRLSDDSSSSSTRIEVGSRKRKSNPYRSISKKKRATPSDEVDGNSKDGEDSPQKDVMQTENDSSSNSKIFDQNSSDVDDSEDKTIKRFRLDDTGSIASRRPVRKRPRPKLDEFEYDLSNLLKMEAQGYRESTSAASIKAVSSKKKTKQDLQNNYNNINKECCGALLSLSRLSVEGGKAQIKSTNFAIFNVTKEQRISNIFVRPMLPKISRVEKVSVVKEPEDVVKDNTTKSSKPDTNDTVVQQDSQDDKQPNTRDKEPVIASNKLNNDTSSVVKDDTEKILNNDTSSVVKDDTEKIPPSQTTESSSQDKSKSNLNLVPIKLRKQTFDLIKNPLIKKNIKEFSKAGMKTKILVIKPLNRKDNAQSINAPLKFQTIKLKDPVNISNEDKKSDQVVVVKVPKVDCARPVLISNNNNESTPLSDTEAKPPDETKDTVESRDIKCDEKCNEANEQDSPKKNNDITESEASCNEISLPVTDADVAVKS